MNQDKILKILEKTGAVLTGHFELSSGLHSNQYIQCALALQYPRDASILCEELARKFMNEGITVVAGPALGGIIISYEIGRALKARSVFSERQEGKMVLRRGFKIEPTDRVLVVEDVVTTGGSIKELIGLVRQAKAKIMGAGVIIDRTESRLDLGLRLESLVKLDIETFPAASCPFCRKGEELLKPGSRRLV